MLRMCAYVCVCTYHFSVQVVGPTDDGKNFDGTDAALKLDLGTPRCVHEQLASNLQHRELSF